MPDDWNTLRTRLSIFSKQASGPDIENDRKLLSRLTVDLPEGLSVVAGEKGGVSGEWIRTGGAVKDKVILYLHGGGYVMGSGAYPRIMGSLIARKTDVSVFCAQYALAPEHPFPAAIHDCVAIYRAMLDQGLKPSDIAIAGESSGGGLAVAAALAAKEAGLPMPAAVYAASPWTDLANQTPSHTENEERDTILSTHMLQSLAGIYAKDCDYTNPLISPVYSDFKEFPPLLVHAGEREILRDDAILLIRKAAAGGCDARAVIVPMMQHVFVLMGDAMTRSRIAVSEMGDFLKRRLGIDL